MTLTAAQVQDIQTTVVTDLQAGTFTLYGQTPAIHKEAQKKSSKNTWIEVLNTRGDIVQAVNGAIILFEDSCELNIHSPSRTNVDKIYADVLNILVASERNYTLKRTRDKPLRSKYGKQIIIELKDI